MLRFKPIIKVRDGVMGVGKKGRGNINIAINIMVDDMLNEADQIDEDYLMITHSLADTEVEYIRERIKDKLRIKHIFDTKAGCVISSHCGKGTIGVLYILK
jgi:fatty acid-binding protein DegV